MNATDEAWGRFAAVTRYSARRTLAQATANRKAVPIVVIDGRPCQVCGRPLQIGYKVLLPSGRPREWLGGYVHTHPRWCRIAQGEEVA